MFKPLTPSRAAIATCDSKAAASACHAGRDQPGLLRAQFSAELRQLLARLVVLR